MKKGFKSEKIVTTGYCGRWVDGTLGWCCPRHLSTKYPAPLDWSSYEHNGGQEAYLCKITLETLPMKRRIFFKFEDPGVAEQRKAVRLGLA